MAERGLLHLNSLAAFAEFLSKRGWTSEPIRGEYEVLRMRNPDHREPLILYARMRSEHATFPEGANDYVPLAQAFLKEKHAAQEWRRREASA